jgi:hypothetical protein
MSVRPASGRNLTNGRNLGTAKDYPSVDFSLGGPNGFQTDSLYFIIKLFLRRNIGPPYLDLLRFFLNQTSFMRSEKSERVGKSLAELLTGQAHWLELLGFTRFKKSASEA